MYRTSDPVADFLAYDAAQARALEWLPVFADCEEPIQDDHYYIIEGVPVCPACLESNYRHEVHET